MKKKYIAKESEVNDFSQKIEKSGTHRRKLKKINENEYAVGVDRKFNDLPDFIIDILQANNLYVERIQNKCHFFRVILQNNIYYETESYASRKITNSSCIKFIENNI